MITLLLFVNKRRCQSEFPEHLTLSLLPVPAFLTKKTTMSYFFGGFLAVWMGVFALNVLLAILFATLQKQPELRE